MRAVALYGTIGSLVLTALGASPAGGTIAPPDPRGSTETQGVAAAAGRAASTGIDFGSCPEVEDLPSSVSCGTVTVPLDYARPDGVTIRLTVSRTPSTGTSAERQGALVYNPGGPGGSGMDFPLYNELPEWRDTARAYDFIGYAPRCVGRSAPLSCQVPAEFTKAPVNVPVHPTEAQKRAGLRRAEAYARGCAEKAGPSLRHYTLLNNVRDLEVIRAALGEECLNFLGSSYGSLGARQKDRSRGSIGRALGHARRGNAKAHSKRSVIAPTNSICDVGSFLRNYPASAWTIITLPFATQAIVYNPPNHEPKCLPLLHASPRSDCS